MADAPPAGSQPSSGLNRPQNITSRRTVAETEAQHISIPRLAMPVGLNKRHKHPSAPQQSQHTRPPASSARSHPDQAQHTSSRTNKTTTIANSYHNRQCNSTTTTFGAAAGPASQQPAQSALLQATAVLTTAPARQPAAAVSPVAAVSPAAAVAARQAL